MNIRYLGHICGIILLAAVFFVTIQLLGGYLIKEITAADNNDEAAVEVVEKTILRLEATDYYTYQVGIFTQSAEAQEVIDAFAKEGYRLWVTAESPYQLLLGSWAENPQNEQLPEEIKNLGQDTVVVKKTLNEVSLKYKDADSIYKERIAPLLSAADVILKQSLNMLDGSSYTQYSETEWQKMTDVLKFELRELDDELEALILSSEVRDREKMSAALKNFQIKLNAYAASLDYINREKSERALFLAESYLLELIAGYHEMITEISE